MSTPTGSQSPNYRYTYSPLASAFLGDIRLIRLWPGPVAAEEIRLEIFHEVSFATPQYEALSYAWGCPDHTDVALVCEAVDRRGKRTTRKHLDETMDELISTSRLGIARNLAVALRHLRYPDRDRILWVDALCINQTDDAEKSREVHQMGSIYGKAQRVIVWLGPSEDDSTLALETLDRIGRGVEFERRIFHVTCQPGTWAQYLASNNEVLRAESPRWVAIAKLIRRGWFSRLWVFQEISLATSSSVVAGKCSIDWELFRLGLYWVWTRIDDINQLLGVHCIEDPFTNSIYGLLTVSDRTVETATTLLLALDLTKKSFCFDKKDRLFAIRGLLIADAQQLITTDYALRTEQVYKATTISYTMFYENPNILTYCVLQSPPLDVEAPSWVPDFSFQEAPQHLRPMGADGSAPGYYSFEEGDILAVQGVKVTEIIGVWASNITQKSTDGELGDVCFTWGKQLSLSAAYVAGGLMEDVLIEAILCGQIEENALTNFGYVKSGHFCKELLLPTGNSEGKEDNEFNEIDSAFVFQLFRRLAIGRAFFTTAEGYIGVCPESAQIGDCVVVILGCEVPLVLRPYEDNKENFIVVGECYVPGIMNAEAILGRLPPGWTKRSIMTNDHRILMIYEQEGLKTQLDPRASTLPPGWKAMFGTAEYPLEDEPEVERNWERIWFKNLEAGKISYYDPRMTPALLKEQGVDVQEFRLV
ncbi:heterokaryon incompatibility protein-domain-containing protein [Rhexocercosporidium sp. MPI-PUGE-AT-0058]|nr:heterokaryon incompatibility protein-domain-containing protein [Rhexocercosporidium sp. MPI-PUGE-AT-0058]